MLSLYITGLKVDTFDHSKREEEELREEMEVSRNWKDVNMSAAFSCLLEHP